MDTSQLSTSRPHKIYLYAGLNSDNVRKCTAQIWFLTGSYHTNERMFSMKMRNSPMCETCQIEENIYHMMLFCVCFSEIRDTFLSEISVLNPMIKKYVHSKEVMIRTILDPECPSLPCDILQSWSNITTDYQLCRDYCWDVHSKKEKSEKTLNHRQCTVYSFVFRLLNLTLVFIALTKCMAETLLFKPQYEIKQIDRLKVYGTQKV